MFRKLIVFHSVLKRGLLGAMRKVPGENSANTNSDNLRPSSSNLAKRTKVGSLQGYYTGLMFTMSLMYALELQKVRAVVEAQW